MWKFESKPLQSFLEAELSAGNKIESGGPCEWGSLKYIAMLRDPFRTRAWEEVTALTFRELNDPHYWKSEVEDALVGEMVTCGFAFDQTGRIILEPSA